VIKKGVLNLLDSARLSEGSSISIHIAFAMMIIDASCASACKFRFEMASWP
jgi:hydrogenase maturation factor